MKRYSNTTYDHEEQDDLTGSPTLDRPIRLTRFPTMGAGRKQDMKATLRQLAAEIEQTEADDKADLPWFKLGVFGGSRTVKGSLRSNGNMVSATGCELDFDDCRYTPLQARHRLRKAGLCFLLYTTPQHLWEGRGNRFRVFLPFSEALPPADRARMVARVNGVLDGLADPASFTMSQSFYAGNVTGRLKVKTYLVEGRYVDTASDLDAGARWKQGREKSANDNGFDEAAYLDAIATGESYHPAAIALAGKWAADGVPYIEAMQRLRAAFDRVSEEDRDSRWKERVADLPTILNHVYGKQVEEDIAEEKRREEAFDDLAWEEWVKDFTATPPNPDIQAAIDELVGDPAEAGFFIDIDDWSKRPAPPREWLVPDLIPNRQVTLLYGDGGTGKSLLSLQLAAAVASGGDWIRQTVARPGKAMVIAAEDDADELHRRMETICHVDGVDMAALSGKLLVRSIMGEDATLATVERKTNALKPTDLYKTIGKMLARHRPSLLVLDTLSHLFGGNENDKAQATAFIGMLQRYAVVHNCAVVLLAHPSMNGMNSGTGTSGNVGWSNSARSRLYLTRMKDEEGNELDTSILKTMKANYGPRGGEIVLRWQGAFIADVQDFAEPPEEKATRVFLKLLDAYAAQDRYVSPNVSSTYAPTVFATHPEREGVGKSAFMKAMERLLTEKVITIAEHGKGATVRQHIERANP